MVVSTPALFRPPSDDEDDVPPIAGPSSSQAHDAEGDVTMGGPSSPWQQQQRGDDGDAIPRDVYEDSEPDSDPDDPLVSVLPVYLTPALSKQLALLQYPHRPPAFHTPYPLLPPSLRPDTSISDRPARNRISARYKPKVGHLELSVPMEVKEGKLKQRFNVERSETLGRGQTDQDLTENGTIKPPSGKKRQKMDGDDYAEGSTKSLERMTLAGEAIPDQTWYACALLRDSMFDAPVPTRAISKPFLHIR